MIITKNYTKFVYIGKLNDEVIYVGRGNLSRATNLIEQSGRHHIEHNFDEVEILGPYTLEESIEKELYYITLYSPKMNKQHNSPFSRKTRSADKGRPEGPTEQTLKIIEDLKSGNSQVNIANKYNLTRQAIYNIKKRWLK